MAVQIQVSDEVWGELKNMKVRPSQTFDDIIKELILNQKGGKKR